MIVNNIEEDKKGEEERQPLVTKTVVSSDPKNSRKKVFINTMSFGLNGLFFAAYNVSNGKLIAMLGDEYSGASGIVTMYLSVILGGSIGLLFSTGLEMAPYISKKDYIGAGKVGKASWLFATGLGVLSSGLMLSTQGFFPSLFVPQTSQTAIDFFSGASIGNIPMLLLIAGSQISFQEGDWMVPPAIGLALFLASTTTGYFLAFKGGMGAFGIGLGASVAQTSVCLATQAWFLKSNYQKYGLYKFTSLSELGGKIKSMWLLGWKISIQRLSEWVNLMLITTLIGIESNSALQAASPSVEYLRILAAAMQGIAQAAGMMLSLNITTMNTRILENKLDEANKIGKDNSRLIIQANVSAALISSIIAGSFYLGRKPIANFFLASDSTPEVEQLAETLLWINMVGFVLDAIRLTSTGALRGWKDTFYPAMINLLIMIVVSVPLGWGVSQLVNDESDETSHAAMMFYVRNIATLIAGGFMVARCRKQINFDFKKISSATLGFFKPATDSTKDNNSSLVTIDGAMKNFTEAKLDG